MNRYNEIMGRVEVTDEMRSRILKNLDEHFAGKKKNRRWFLVLGNMAVAAAIILMVVVPWNRELPEIDSGIEETMSGGVMSGYGSQEYKTVDELSAAVGFNVPQIENVPFDVRDTLYLSIGEGFAEIDYTNEKESLSFRKSLGAEDNSGIYSDYPLEKQIQVLGVNVTLKGEQGRIYLAAWTDGNYAYSIYDESGLNEEIMIQIVTELISG